MDDVKILEVFLAFWGPGVHQNGHFWGPGRPKGVPWRPVEAQKWVLESPGRPFWHPLDLQEVQKRLGSKVVAAQGRFWVVFGVRFGVPWGTFWGPNFDRFLGCVLVASWRRLGGHLGGPGAARGDPKSVQKTISEKGALGTRKLIQKTFQDDLPAPQNC